MKHTEIMDRWTHAKATGDTALAGALENMGETQRALISAKRQLSDSATSAIMRLERLIAAIDAYDPETDEEPQTWNSLGTLQGLGCEIDRLCGEAALLVRMHAAWRRHIEAIEKTN